MFLCNLIKCVNLWVVNCSCRVTRLFFLPIKLSRQDLGSWKTVCVVAKSKDDSAEISNDGLQLGDFISLWLSHSLYSCSPCTNSLCDHKLKYSWVFLCCTSVNFWELVVFRLEMVLFFFFLLTERSDKKWKDCRGKITAMYTVCCIQPRKES